MDLEAIATLATSLGTMIFIGLAILRFGPQQRQAITAGDLNEVQAMEAIVRQLQTKSAQSDLAQAKAEEMSVRQRTESARVVNRLEDKMKKMVTTQADERAQRLGITKELNSALGQLSSIKAANKRLTKEYEGIQALYLEQSNKVAALEKLVEELQKNEQILKAQLEAYEKSNESKKPND